MNKFKRLCLLPCLLLTFCVGFLLTDSLNVYAYSESDNFYPFIISSSKLHFTSSVGITSYTVNINDGKMKFSNPALSGITDIRWIPNVGVTFPYNPDLFDYYIIGTLTAKDETFTQSTYKPTSLRIYYVDYDSQTVQNQYISDSHIYNIDNGFASGFGFYGKVDFESSDNIGINMVGFGDDKEGSGSKPANLVLELGIYSVSKSGSTDAEIHSQILAQLKQMESSITENIQNGSNAVSSAVGQSAEKITGAINDQYEMEESEDFGVNDITSNVEEKLGVLTVGTDTLVGFLDLFNASSAGSTTITFPAFQIEVGGQSYNVWNDVTFDLAILDENFGVLIDAVRTVTVLCVWMAVLSYLVKAKDHFLNSGG